MGNVLTQLACYDRENRSCCSWTHIFKLSQNKYAKKKKKMYTNSYCNNFNTNNSGIPQFRDNKELYNINSPPYFIEAVPSPLNEQWSKIYI